MPVNFNILQPIQPPQMLGSLPQGPSTSQQVGDLGQGLMQGILQGQQMQGNAQQLELGRMQLDKAKSEKQRAEALGAAAAKSKEDYYGLLMKTDPPAAMAAMKAEQDFNNSVLQGDKTITEIKGLKLDQAIKVNNSVGHFAGAISQIAQKDPAKARSIYNEKMPEVFNSLGIEMPESLKEYSEANVTMLTAQSTIFAAEIAKNKEEGNKTTEKVATLNQLEEKEQQLTARIAEVSKNKGDTSYLETQLKRTQELIATHTQNKQTVKTVSGALGELDITDLKTAQDEAKKSDQTLGKIQAMRAANKKFTTGATAGVKLAVGKGLRAVGAPDPFNTPYGEALNAFNMDFVMDWVAQSKGAISDREMEGFTKASPGMINTQPGNELILDSMEAVELRKKEKINFQKTWAKKYGSLDGANEAWDKFINENPLLNPETLKLENKSSSKDWKNYLDPNYVKPPTKTVDGITYEKREDGWHTKND